MNQRKVKQFIISSRTGQDEFQHLVNTPGVSVINIHDQNVVVPGTREEVGEAYTTRTVDYIEQNASDRIVDDTYSPPVV